MIKNIINAYTYFYKMYYITFTNLNIIYDFNKKKKNINIQN